MNKIFIFVRIRPQLIVLLWAFVIQLMNSGTLVVAAMMACVLHQWVD